MAFNSMVYVGDGRYSYYIAASAAAGGVKSTVIMPGRTKFSSFQLSCSGAAIADIEATIDPVSMVKAGTASWKSWGGGTATAGAVNQDGTEYPITAARLNVTNGVAAQTATMSIQAV